MKQFSDIVIWEPDPGRVQDITHNLRVALKERGFTASISAMTESPLIGRAGLTGKTPVLEIENNFWSLPQGVPITEEACMLLVDRLTRR